MEILHVAAEVSPYAKAGGLGDVLQGLVKELVQKGHHVRVLLPKYTHHISTLEVSSQTTYPISFDGAILPTTVWQGKMEGLSVVLVEPPPTCDFFSRKEIYGYTDDVARFTYFCVAALAYIRQNPPDIIHLHDWHTALLAGLLKELSPPVESKVVLTIHNLDYIGLCTPQDLQKTGWSHPQLQIGAQVSLLKGGIVFADYITTVSPTYAKEILTTELGGPLQSTLQQHRHPCIGIRNGIDYDYWNPEKDPALSYPYSRQHLENKKKNKQAYKERLGLSPLPTTPLIGIITRLVPQKGLELIKASLLRTLAWGGQFVLLGSAPPEQMDSHFRHLQQAFKGNHYVCIELQYHEEHAHLLYAAADLLIAPSLFEPCGLIQQIAMRYGTLPLVRACGGFMDTVEEGKNGFLFGPPTVEALYAAIDRALEIWFHEPKRWEKLVQEAMETDHSWVKPAEEYLKIYHLSKRAATLPYP